ncbi:hypothetical protein CES86_1367 [Brucella lupini]|uniref:Uncharacterized protein n=1 Tax=Brucella lupini TaxID=255457 RepID=A0A256GW81_9HYPH|nr:hypothetical protein CES86_1367 [Brucella lupini]
MGLYESGRVLTKSSEQLYLLVLPHLCGVKCFHLAAKCSITRHTP